MTWIQTFSGKQFWPLEPKPEDVHIEDIAHSLSMRCRFNGHCIAFYSIAQHSVLVSKLTPKRLAVWGLLHDAGEAYLPDMPRPIKQFISGFNEIENRIMMAIAEALRLPWPMPEEINQADEIALATEARDLMVHPPKEWNIKSKPISSVVIPLSPEYAKKEFMNRYHELIDH